MEKFLEQRQKVFQSALNGKKERDKEQETADEEKCNSLVGKIDFAFQPIVNIHNGVCLGFEALLRDYEKAGFDSIHDMFDFLYEAKILYWADIKLREKAIAKFCRISFKEKCKLFYNIDSRFLTMPNYTRGNTVRILARYEMKSSDFCLEISERQETSNQESIRKLYDNYKEDCFKTALDDFGAGFSGLQQLYLYEPEYIKIDRFFIKDISRDLKKKLFVSRVINLAHTLGVLVIAEGVETIEELSVCRTIGCDLVQGFFVQRPSVNLQDLTEVYTRIAEISIQERRSINTDNKLIKEEMIYIEPVFLAKHTMLDVLKRLRNQKVAFFLPVLNYNNEPIGIIKEQILKEYIYSKYGYDLFSNTSIGQGIENFTTKCPIAEIYTSLENILELYTVQNSQEAEGIILTDNGKYIGFLSTHALLKVLNEQNLGRARSQNPLTHLPGNNVINEYLSKSLIDDDKHYFYIYFDFDNFKPFNDVYGFREGDRAILLFADILRKHLSATQKYFVGHIGGDDFFAGLYEEGISRQEIINLVKFVCQKFANDVLCFYNENDRRNEYIISHSREGKEVKFPLLSVSAAILYLSRTNGSPNLEELSSIIAEAKKRAKINDTHFSFTEIK